MDIQKIERFRWDGLKNAEFTLAVPHILFIADHSPVGENIGRRLEAVRDFLPDLDRIEAQDRKWADSQLMEEAERLRDGYVNSLIRTERTQACIVVPGCEEASKKLTALFDKHGRDIASDTNIAETQRIYNLVEDVERTPGMTEALATFALTQIYELMQVSNSRFDELWQRRNQEQSLAEHVDSKAVRTKCVKAINLLYDGIEYLAAENENPAWTQLIHMLSRLNSYYKQQLKARATRRKNKSKTKPEDEPLIPPLTELS